MPPLWRDGREAEGAPLLREYRVKSLIEGSNPSLSAIHLTTNSWFAGICSESPLFAGFFMDSVQTEMRLSLFFGRIA